RSRNPRIEPQDEQLDEAARDRTVCDERVFHVALAEERAGLPEVTAVRAQQRDLAPRESRGEYQPVETVVLRATVDDGKKRVREETQRTGIDHRSRGGAQVEPLHPQWVTVLRHQFVRVLVVDHYAEIREAGQDLGQRRLLAAAVELQVEMVGAHSEACGERLR